MLREAPMTRVVRMKVSDTATYSREKAVEVEAPHHADKETIQALIPELDITCCCSASRCRAELVPLTRRPDDAAPARKGLAAAIKEFCLDQQVPCFLNHHFK